MTINSRSKGARGELELAARLRELGFGDGAKRSAQHSGKGGGPADVIDTLDGVHIEVKRTERFRLYEALEQAEGDCPPPYIPAVFHRRNREPWVVIVHIDDMLEFAKCVVAAHEKNT